MTLRKASAIQPCQGQCWVIAHEFSLHGVLVLVCLLWSLFFLIFLCCGVRWLVVDALNAFLQMSSLFFLDNGMRSCPGQLFSCSVVHRAVSASRAPTVSLHRPQLGCVHFHLGSQFILPEGLFPLPLSSEMVLAFASLCLFLLLLSRAGTLVARPPSSVPFLSWSQDAALGSRIFSFKISISSHLQSLLCASLDLTF